MIPEKLEARWPLPFFISLGLDRLMGEPAFLVVGCNLFQREYELGLGKPPLITATIIRIIDWPD